MNNDGFGQVGSGSSDNRVAGEDLQHNRQTRTGGKPPREHRIVRQQAGEGGPMKKRTDQNYELHHHLNVEKERHKHAMEHQELHYERHRSRHHDSQHGHDGHKHHYSNHHSM